MFRCMRTVFPALTVAPACTVESESDCSCRPGRGRDHRRAQRDTALRFRSSGRRTPGPSPRRRSKSPWSPSFVFFSSRGLACGYASAQRARLLSAARLAAGFAPWFFGTVRTRGASRTRSFPSDGPMAISVPNASRGGLPASDPRACSYASYGPHRRSPCRRRL